MAKQTYERTLFYYLPACANVNAPTAAEITAGTNLTAEIPVDGGWTNASTQNKASEAFFGEGFISEAIGTDSDSLTLVFKYDTEATPAGGPAWNLIDKNVTGYMLRAPSGSVAVGEQVQIFPVEFGRKQLQAPSANTIQKWTCEAAVTDLPAYEAVVAV